MNSDTPKKRRGFAVMTPEQRAAIASLGSRAAHAKGTAHEWNRETAAAAGRKGGAVSRGGKGRVQETSREKFERLHPDMKGDAHG